MAIPTHYLKRRDLLHSDRTSAATLSATAAELFAAERYSEALDFYEKARDTAGVQKILALATERGDTFLLARLERYDRTLVKREDFEAAAQKSAANGQPSRLKFVARRFAAAGTPAAAAVKPGENPVEEVH